MKLNRKYVTPFVTLVFLMVGLSGVLMFFHLFDGYTEVAHEVLGMLFVVCAIFHILLNWKGLKMHFKKEVFLPAALGVLTITAVLIVGERMYPPIDTVIINSLVKAPLQDAFKALNINYEEASLGLQKKGMSMDGAATIEAIWVNNGSDPEAVIDLLLQ